MGVHNIIFLVVQIWYFGTWKCLLATMFSLWAAMWHETKNKDKNNFYDGIPGCTSKYSSPIMLIHIHLIWLSSAKPTNLRLLEFKLLENTQRVFTTSCPAILMLESARMGWISRSACAQKSHHIQAISEYNVQIYHVMVAWLLAVCPGILHMINWVCCMPRNSMGCMC